MYMERHMKWLYRIRASRTWQMRKMDKLTAINCEITSNGTISLGAALPLQKRLSQLATLIPGVTQKCDSIILYIL